MVIPRSRKLDNVDMKEMLLDACITDPTRSLVNIRMIYVQNLMYVWLKISYIVFLNIINGIGKEYNVLRQRWILHKNIQFGSLCLKFVQIQNKEYGLTNRTDLIYLLIQQDIVDICFLCIYIFLFLHYRSTMLSGSVTYTEEFTSKLVLHAVGVNIHSFQHHELRKQLRIMFILGVLMSIKSPNSLLMNYQII